MRRWILGFGVGLIAMGSTIIAVAAWMVWRQGPNASDWSAFKLATVRFDRYGIPTITAPNWEALAKAEGFVVASQRLWQMDLTRRSAGGRLAEWFGDSFFDHDAAKQAEDRLAVTKRAAAQMAPEERRFCDAYADGVNQFIDEFSGRWGIEYLITRQQPEPWQCADTLLVLLEMADALSSSAAEDAQQAAWRRNLSPGWQAFLFADAHPWNQPLFGQAPRQGPLWPSATEYLPPMAVRSGNEPLPTGKAGRSEKSQGEREARVVYHDRPAIGSNSWAWRGPTGAFLANDPHLPYSVPGIWYALRLRVSSRDWAVGVALPGMPGVALGMNPGIAWAFTNTGEDVDDYLLETLSNDGERYRVQLPDGREEWRPLQVKTLAIKVAGETEPRTITARFTHRGPLAERRFVPGLYSRQWLPLKDGRLTLPLRTMQRSATLAEANSTFDEFGAIAQNVLIMNRAGDIAFRLSGTGVVRKASGAVPRAADEGEWLGFEPPTHRPRLFFQGEGDKVRFLATANQRIWAEEGADIPGHRWASDDRVERLNRALSERQDFQRADMEALQLDTQSRFLKLLLAWVLDHSGEHGPMADAWRSWDGTSTGDSKIFSAALEVEHELSRLLLIQVQRQFAAEADRQVPYQSSLRRAWMVAVLEAPGRTGLQPFGFDATEVARWLYSQALARAPHIGPHQEINHWQVQHPFVGQLAVVGRFFAIDNYPQWGSSDLVRAETPDEGPSARLVWDLKKPWESTWTFPVGQSGHVFDPHYRDFHTTWAEATRVKVFADESPADWGFPSH